MASKRLQKILAAAGFASRRKAEEIITSGRVSVNGTTVTELGTKADLETDDVRLDGKRIREPEQHVYIMIYKPREFVTTVSDPEGRSTVMDLVRDVRERVFPVGRLDFNSEGLLLLTNDGDLMQQLTAPTSHVPKTYLVKVSGQPTEEAIDRLRQGIKLPAEPSMTKGRGTRRPGESRRSFSVTTLPAKVQIVREGDNPWYEITLTEGRNRQIRRMFEEVGHHVEKIKRVKYGPLKLDVEAGKWRYLSERELSSLRFSLKKPFSIKPPRGEGERDMRGERDIRKLADRVIGKAKQTHPRREWSGTAPKREWTPRPPREGGDRPPRREGGFAGREGAPRTDRPPRFEKREGGFERPRRESSFSAGPKREGGFKREGSFARGPKREGGFAKREGGFEKREGGFRKDAGPRREGGPPKREGGFARGPRREGGFEKREGGFSRGPRPEGGFARGPKREGSFRSEGGPKREGGFSRGPRREGSFRPESGPKREGGFSRGPKPEGGFSRGPRREGGFTPGPKREGGFSRGAKREGGFRGGPRPQGGPKRPGGSGRGPKREGGPRRGRE